MEESGVIGAGLSIGVPFFRRRWSHDSAREAQDDQDDDECEDTRRAVVRRDKPEPIGRLGQSQQSVLQRRSVALAR